MQPALQTRINGTFMSFDIKNAMMWQKVSPFPWTLQLKMVAYLFFVLLGSVPAFEQTGMLKGVLTDESGGVVAGAKVTLAGFLWTD